MDKGSREKLPPLPLRRAVHQQSNDGEDEQVEKFYALLDNIRVEKHLFRSWRSKRKRSRMEEPPWKPMFTMQDFKETKGDDIGGPSKIAAAGGSGETSEASRIGHRGDDVEAKEVNLRLTLSLG